MRKRVFFILPIITALVACQKKPTACIDMEPVIPAGEPVEFISCSEDYEFLTWEFGDGTGNEAESPEHNYNTEGSWEVILTAYADGAFRSDEVSETIHTSFKYIDRMEITGQVFDDRLEFFVNEDEVIVDVEPGTYTQENPLVVEIYSLSRINVTNRSVTVGIRTPNSSFEIASRIVNFSRLTREYAEILSSNLDLRVYWRLRSESDY